jgi:hypothetical protein
VLASGVASPSSPNDVFELLKFSGGGGMNALSSIKNMAHVVVLK